MPLYVDETNVIAGGTNIQSSGLDGFSLGARSDGAAGTFAQLDIAFAAIIGRALTSLEIADMHAWAQTTYAVT